MEPPALTTNLQKTQANRNMPNYQTTAQRCDQQNQTESLKTGDPVSSPTIETESGRGTYRLRDTLNIDKAISIIIIIDYERTGKMWTLDNKELLSSWYYHLGGKRNNTSYLLR